MWHEVVLDGEFFAKLEMSDAEIAAEVAAAGCRRCGGPLHRGDYERKPRGGIAAVAGEAFRRRFSLCCGRPGCRRRATPPSLRFLGRKVYLEAVVVIAGVVARVAETARAILTATGVPARTVSRWGEWWRTSAQGRWWRSLSGRFVPPPPDGNALPWSLVMHLEKMHVDRRTTLTAMAKLLAPLTTASVAMDLVS
jgi:hypothetical protein